MGYEVTVPLGVMELLPSVGESVTLATVLVVREDGWALYGFLHESERRVFQRLLTVNGVGPRIAVAFLSALGAERGAKAIRKKDIGALSSVRGIGRKLAERLALELGDKLGELVSGEPAPMTGPAEGALRALERLATAPPTPSARCARRSRATVEAATRKRWCAVPCRCSPTRDHDDCRRADDDRRMDLHPLRFDQPEARAGDRDAYGRRVRHLPREASHRG